MKKFRFKIGYKITIGYLVLLVFIASALLVVSRTIESLQTEIDTLIQRDLKIQELSYQIDKNASDMEAGLNDYAIAGEESSKEAVRAAIARWEANGQQLAGLLAGEDAQLSRMNSVTASIEQWIAIAERELEVPAGTRSLEDIRAFALESAGQKQMDGMREQLSRLRQADKYAMEQRVGSLHKQTSELQTLLFAFAGALTVLTIAFSWIVSRSVSVNIRRVTAAVADIARSGGDLTKRIQVRATDETMELGRETNGLLASLQTMMREIREQAGRLADVSETIRTGTSGALDINGQVNEAVRRVAEGAESQVARTQEISAIMAETMKGLEQVAARTQDVSELARATREDADSGSVSLDRSQQEIERIETIFGTIQGSVGDLSRRAGRIQDIAVYISEVSKQTNLLALNAAIEAARAGAHGRGFTVVSAEIRKLSDETAESARQITATLDELNEGVGQIVELMAGSAQAVYNGTSSLKEAGGSVKSVVESVGSLAERVIEAASAIEQIAAGSRHVVRSAEEISRVTEETSAFAEQMSAMVEEQNASLREFAASSDGLNGVSGTLRDMTGHFKV